MPSVFGCIPPGSRYGNVPNELIHRAGPPFLDNHYRGYQYDTTHIWFCSPPKYVKVAAMRNTMTKRTIEAQRLT